MAKTKAKATTVETESVSLKLEKVLGILEKNPTSKVTRWSSNELEMLKKIVATGHSVRTIMEACEENNVFSDKSKNSLRKMVKEIRKEDEENEE